MLLGYNKHKRGDHEEHYVDARRKIDVLCGLIVSGRLSRRDAVETYREIENDFANRNPAEAELFGMIYKNRVNRLCDQFCRK